MPALGTWLLIGGVVALGSIVFFVARNEIVKKRLTCPRTGEEAEVCVQRRFEGRKDLRVKSCNLLDDPQTVDCEQACIKEVAR